MNEAIEKILKNPIFIIAKKEIMDNVRNYWIIFVIILFSLLTIVTSYFGSVFSQGWQDFGATIGIMSFIVQILVTIIAIMVGYAAIIGEIEKGSMNSFLALPINRLEIILGKFFGLGCVISFSILIGFGLAGIIIGLNVDNVNIIDYLYFIGDTILVGLVFLSISMFFSTLFKKRSTAIGGGIFLWLLFIFILPLIFQSILITQVGLENYLSQNYIMPEWTYFSDLLNPINVYSILIISNVGPTSSALSNIPIELNYPSFYTPLFLVIVLSIWIVTFVLISYLRFNRKDI